jgi:hypothetical protein
LRTLGWDLSSNHHIGSWFLNTTLVQDALEILIDRSRRYWWAEKHLLATASFAIIRWTRIKKTRNLTPMGIPPSGAIRLSVVRPESLLPRSSRHPNLQSIRHHRFDVKQFSHTSTILPGGRQQALTGTSHIPTASPNPSSRFARDPKPIRIHPILVLRVATYLLPYTTHTSLLDRDRHHQHCFLPASIYGPPHSHRPWPNKLSF